MKILGKTVKIGVLVLILASLLYSANKAVFLHGFGTDKTAWTNSGTPDDLAGVGVIHSYLNIDYDMNRLAEPNGLNELTTGIVAQIRANNNAGQDKWIIIGHSMGGLVARGLELQIRQLYPDIRLVGVLTTGTPHQGARPAFAVDGQPGSSPYYNGRALLDNFKWDILHPLEADYTGNLPFLPQSVQAIFGWFGTSLLNWTTVNGLTSDLFLLDDLIEMGYNEGLDWLRLSGQANAGQWIGPPDGVRGTVITQLNAFPTTTAKRSIIGAEKSPTIIRWLSEFQGITQGANETDIFQQYERTTNFYRTNRDVWKTIEDGSHFYCTRYIYRFYFMVLTGFDPCFIEDLVEGKSDMWNSGVAAWENMDSRWGEMIDSYVLETRTGYHWVVDCKYAERGGDCQWVYQGYTYTVLVPTKNDGLLGPQYNRWNGDDVWDPSPSGIQTMRDQGNWYYSDGGADGGYNHGELKRYRRAYTLPGVFNAGDEAKPMKEAADWMRKLYE